MILKRVLLTVCLLPLAIAAIAQKVTLTMNNAPLDSVFISIEQQTRYKFWYKSELLSNTRRVSLNVKDAHMRNVLDLCFKDQTIKYKIRGKDIFIKKRNNKINESSDAPPLNLINTQEKVENEKPEAKLLEEMVITGYGKTSTRFNTGTIGKISSHDIAKQPIGNVLGAVEGIPGLLYNQSSGLPGSQFDLQIRGQSSIGITPGIFPPSSIFFVIDGVPLAPHNNPLTTIASSSALGAKGSSPFAAINPDDIERIEVLKDADATSIYGSRGADGVVLITTRQGKAGKRLLTANIYTGISSPTTIPKMLHTRQFLEMRQEAFTNDNLPANINNAPDLMLFDPVRYTDVKSLLLGETAKVINSHVSVSGGDSNTQYIMSAGHRYETTVFPGNLGDHRTSLHFRIAHNSINRKFSVQLSSLFAVDKNKSILTDLTSALTITPNIPSLHDADNKLMWQYNGVATPNPLGSLMQTYLSQTKNLLSNLQISYKLFKCLAIKSSFGYNNILFKENSIIPGKSLNPFVVSNPTGSSFLSTNDFISKIIEPQIEFSGAITGGNLTWLIGGTLEEVTNNRSNTSATGFINDERLTDLSAAHDIIYKKQKSIYRYEGIFGRLSYNWHYKYLINLTGRRDGSSRFGPKKQFGNFGAIGAAWIFTNDSIIKRKIPFISFGKLRGSYGITGNDQIGDYKYFDRWNQTILTYLGNTGVVPVQISDSSYSWEVTRKLEGALELGVFNDQLNIIVNYYRNTTGNQLVSQMLPYATGFSSIAAKNSKAVVQNSGFEITLKSKNIIKKNASWLTDVTITFPRNKLQAFPDLANSSYGSRYMEGRSLTWNTGYDYIGIDPNTGVFQFADQDGDGKLSYPNDYIQIGNLDPKFYGWLKNSFTCKNWVFDISMEYKKQMGYSALYHVYNTGGPGTQMLNQPTIVLNRWQKPGDRAIFQRYTTGSNSLVAAAANNFLQSSGRFGDASSISIKNVSLSYNLPKTWTDKMHVKMAGLYVRIQNLFTITNRNVFGQQIQTPYALTPLRTVAVGFQCSF
jgi:TonB-dependent starch-binding outer membrane protein SusC